jgi:hypothetical protein
MEHFIENIYMYEKNILNENDNILTHRKLSDINEEINENDENIKINKQKKNICNCENDDTLHICCGIISSAIFFSFIKIF